MSTLLSNVHYLSSEDMQRARDGQETLAKYVVKDVPIQMKIAEESVELPISVMNLLLEALEQTAQGHQVSLVHSDTEMTTQQAADYLNVSRPFLVKLLEENQIPFTKVGTHRRVRFEDVASYKENIDKKRRLVLDELAKQAQELDMGY